MYKRHYETENSVYWICTLANKLKCKQRVIAEKSEPVNIRFKGPGHNHTAAEYHKTLFLVNPKDSPKKSFHTFLWSKNGKFFGRKNKIEMQKSMIWYEVWMIGKEKLLHSISNYYLLSSNRWNRRLRRRSCRRKGLPLNLLSKRTRQLPKIKRLLLSKEHNQSEHHELALYHVPKLQV